MPPRTTQKSCKAWPLRQKSQIEPWLAHRPQILLVGVSVWHRQFDADTMYPTTPSAALLLLKAKDHRRRKGLNDENYLSPASRERCFLLTLPFIEPGQKTSSLSLAPAIRRKTSLSSRSSCPGHLDKRIQNFRLLWCFKKSRSQPIGKLCNHLAVRVQERNCS